MTARATTADDLVRALRGLARRPAVRAAVRERAGAFAAAVSGEGVTATIADAADGATVTVAGPGLFAREFGSQEKPAGPVVARAVDAMRR